MHLETTEGAERPWTIGARVRPDTRVNAGVQRQQRSVLEASAAVGADVRRGVRVRTFVVCARAVLREALRAAVDAADVRPLARVCAHVRRQRRRRPELPPAFAAHAQPLFAGRSTGAGDGSSGGGGVAVGRCVRPALVHC